MYICYNICYQWQWLANMRHLSGATCDVFMCLIIRTSLLMLFSLSLSFRLDKATNENNTSEQWDVILEICDKVGHSSKNSKESLQAIVRRLNHTDPHVGVQAVTVSC